MAKKGTATATIGLDYSAFEAGSKVVVKLSQQMASVIRDTLVVAAGNVLASAFSKAAGAISSFAKSAQDNLADVFATGEQMANLAHATGMATGEYLKFTTAASKGITMDEAGKLLGKNAEIMQKDAGIFREVSLKLYAVGERINGFWLGVADKIAPVLMPLLDQLMSLDLSQWGQAFAEPIANAVAIITQLALDGTLWQTMGELAGAAFKYAAEILGKAVSVFSSEGFSAGIESFTNEILKMGEYLYSVLGNSIGRAFASIGEGIIKYGNYLLGIVDKVAVFLGMGTEEDAQEQKSIRDQSLNEFSSMLDDFYDTPEREKNSSSVLTQLKDLFANTQFGSPELTDRISAALEKFQTKTSPNSNTFSNNTATQNFGVSSLAAVGGGGGVGFMSLTEHAAQQTRHQENIDNNVRLLVEGMGKTNTIPPPSYGAVKTIIK